MLSAATALAVSGAVHAVAQGNSRSAIERGRERYLATGCWQCHGYEGQGGAGPRIGPDPLPLPAFTAYVRAPAGDMPPYRAKVLLDADLAAIHAYLATRPERVVLPGSANSQSHSN